MAETHRITRIVPPVWLLLAMVSMYLINGFAPGMTVFPDAFMPLGQAFILGGFTLAFYVVRQFRRAGTPLKPFTPVKAMVTDGPFRYSRNPVYLGMFLMLAGWGVYLGGLMPWLVVAAFVWAIRRFWVLPEERQMERTMGEAYLRYKQEVRRWL